MKISKDTVYLLITGLILFLLILPLSLKVNFMQNDDWVYYRNVQSFLQGNFSLIPEMAPTFYLQGLIGSLFALIFGITKLPLLTLLFSIANFMIFCFIVKDFFKQSTINTLLMGLLFFFNPLNVYSTFGFMTESYFMFFLLCSVYFFLKFQKTKNRGDLNLFFLFSVLGFFIRQISLVTLLTASVYFLIKKSYKSFWSTLFVFSSTLFFYQVIFPKTPEMVEKGFQFHHIFERGYAYSLIYGSLILLAAFSIPLIMGLIQKVDKKKIRQVIFYSVLLFVILNHFYKPMSISWGEFPYFENTYERTGFLARGILGTKYQFRGIYDLYKYWDLGAKILLSVFVSIVILNKRKKIVNYQSIWSILYLCLLVVTFTVYDRYLLFLFPFGILFILNLEPRINKILLSAFVIFLGFYTYQFSYDFVLSNNYVWSKANEIVKKENIQPNSLYVNGAWSFEHGGCGNFCRYMFSFDSPEVNKEINYQYQTAEKKKIDYTLNIHINPNIYLYRIK